MSSQEPLRQLLLGLLFFGAGALYVMLDTLRITAVSRGSRHLAAGVAALMIVLFFVAAEHIFKGSFNIMYVLAYGLGYAAGTYAGLHIEGQLAMGHVTARVLTQGDARALVDHLRSRSYEITTISATGPQGRVRVLYCVIKRRAMQEFVRAVHERAPSAFISFEDVRALMVSPVTMPEVVPAAGVVGVVEEAAQRSST